MAIERFRKNHLKADDEQDDASRNLYGVVRDVQEIEESLACKEEQNHEDKSNHHLAKDNDPLPCRGDLLEEADVEGNVADCIHQEKQEKRNRPNIACAHTFSLYLKKEILRKEDQDYHFTKTSVACYDQGIIPHEYPCWDRMRKPRAPTRGLFLGQKVAQSRVISFIDGFNLYHAISSLRRPELKWVDVRMLSKAFLRPISERIVNVFYFSAYADHMSERVQKSQKAYIEALKLTQTVPVLGQFKNRERKCPNCSHKWISHEEKETDVNIASFLVDLAYQDAFDRALIISNDSDLVPAIRIARKRFPEKRITTIAPPNYYHSNELIQVSSDKARIRPDHLEKSLLPSLVRDASGQIAISCPEDYAAQAVYPAG